MMSTMHLPSSENFGRKRSDSMVSDLALVSSDVNESMTIRSEVATA
jgi:hypothetical protein